MKAALILFAALSLPALAGTDPYIHDVEGLLNSLPSKDPTRLPLTLKLADAVFNEALKISTLPSPSAQDTRQMEGDRRRAIRLYQDSLSGLSGLFAAPAGATRAKIQFQLARLYNDQGDSAAARKIWTELIKQDSVPEIQRESLLRLAEAFENDGSHAALARAEEDYKKALELCSGQDVCSYTHYRLAWVFERQERGADAVAEMKKALWDSKGQVREESLRDLVSFLANIPDDGKDSLAYIEELAAKINRPGLISNLSDAYFAHGNRKAAVYILEAVNRKNPSLKSYVRLMEEDYGFRDWQKFDTEMDGAFTMAAKGADAETEKVLRRLTVQLDGERASQPQLAEEFKRSVMLYLAVFPNSPERTHMIDGWLAAEKSESEKIQQLKTWIKEEQVAKRTNEEVRLRKIRAAVAQKSADWPVVIEEMTALENFAETPAKKREAAYQIAYAQYLNKSYDAALPLFQRLAQPGPQTPDEFAIQSEHLALDILAKKKAYPDVLKQVRLWTKDARFGNWKKNLTKHAAELQDLQNVESKAEFEWAALLGTTQQALEIFQRDCEANVLLPESCSNAQVLAVKLGNEAALIAILKKLGKKDELTAELEASGEFFEAAQMLEKNLNRKTSPARDYLKTALLYELASKNVQRDHVLKEMTIRLASERSLGPEEDLILQTLKEAGLLDAGILRLPWKKENREYLTDYLVSQNKGTPALKAQLVNSCRDTGPAWESLAQGELQKLDQAQSKIHFGGKGSKRKFERRVAALKRLVERGNCYLENSTPAMRVKFATLLSKSEAGLAEEIKASPIPEGVDEQGKASLEKALAEMAQPFADKATELQKLADAQAEKAKASLTQRDPLKAELQPQSSTVLKEAISELHRNPNQKQSLAQLKNYYESNGSPRLAAYFEGRLLQLERNEGVKK